MYRPKAHIKYHVYAQRGSLYSLERELREIRKEKHFMLRVLVHLAVVVILVLDLLNIYPSS
jgi:hypothetical protein